MAGSFSLTYSGTTITLSPLSRSNPRFDIDPAGTISRRMLDGTLRKHISYTKRIFEFEVNNVSKSDADNINGWKQNEYTLVLVPDTDVGGTSYNVKIMNDGKPLVWMSDTAADSKFQGTLILGQV